WRRGAWHLERRLQCPRKIIVVGQSFEAQALAEKLESAIGGKIKVAGIVVYESEYYEGSARAHGMLDDTLHKWPVLGGALDIGDCLVAVKPDQVFICSNLPQEYKAEVVCACVAENIRVYLVPDLYEIMLIQSKLDQVDDVPVFSVGRLGIPEESVVIKRITDILLSLAAIVITFPLCVVVSAAIKLDSRGPVLYRQKRLTLQGKQFFLYKFRTMVEDAEQESGPVLASENDPRVTRVGRLLRATRIDEIPQLLNVLKGDMSIVGPRPERPFFVSKLVSETPEYAFRMNVKSGITGLAQIAGRYSTSAENKLKYDLLYTKSYSPAKDLAILFQTVKVILMKDKAS
ncbi:MAG: sugar transferase, partial [Desulfotomaculaceae bacterium]|nr:sugar transferase [Desulfotomaculaceae bacterium]